MLAEEVDVNVSRQSITNSTHGFRNRPRFTIIAYLYRRMTTIQCSSTSRSATVVVLQHATESLTAFDLTCNGIDPFLSPDEFVAQSLMVPFAMVMLDVFTHGVLQ